MKNLVYWNCKEKGSALPVAVNEDGDTADLETLCARLAAYEDTGLEPEEIKDILERYRGFRAAISDETGQPMVSWTRASKLVRADKEGRVVLLDEPRKPLVWGDDNHNSCLCPDCGEDLMGIPYGEYMILQCPMCGQYLDATKILTRTDAEAALEGGVQT